MINKLKIRRDILVPPLKDPEVALFTCALQSDELRKAISDLTEVTVPDEFTIEHRTNPDDPPDIVGLKLGWECSEFPPNQSAIGKVHSECSESGMVIPPFAETGSDIRMIRDRSSPFQVEPPFANWNDEVAALSSAFFGKLLSGPKSKDVSGNDVLLLDHRQETRIEMTASAIRNVLSRHTPRHIRLVVIAGFRPQRTGHVPEVVVLRTGCFGR